MSNFLPGSPVNLFYQTLGLAILDQEAQPACPAGLAATHIELKKMILSGAAPFGGRRQRGCRSGRLQQFAGSGLDLGKSPGRNSQT